MKKTVLIIMVCVMLLIATSCTAFIITSESVPTHIPTEVTEPSQLLFDFSTSLYQTGENSDVFSTKKTSVYNSREYTDSTASQIRTMDVFGTTYELQYANSAAYALTGQEIHVYKMQGTENSKVFIDAQTDTVVKYVNVPYTPTEKTEEDYTQTVMDLVGNTVDLSAYEYSCATWYMAVYDNGAESKEIPGFHVCGENEYLKTYTFGYNKYIGDYRSIEHVTAIFDADSITLEIIDLAYDTDLIVKLMDCWDVYQLEIANYFASITKNDYSIQKIESISHMFFMRDGVLHVVSTAELTFAPNNEATFTTVAQTITACIPKSS